MALLRMRPLVDCGYGGQMKEAERSSLSYCWSFRNALWSRQWQLMKGMKASPPPPLITAVIKRRKNFPLDLVVQRQKKLKLVTVIKDLLIKEPGMVMSLKRLGRYRKKLRLQHSRRVITLLKKYPAVFDVFEEGVNSLFFRLTPEAEDQVFEEIRLKGELESAAVAKIRKMLMMSLNKTLLLSKIDHLKRDLGLPDDYREIMIENYPNCFKVIATPEGPALELTAWDPELAISAWEKKQLAAPIEDDTISGRPRRFAKLDLPRGQVLKRKDVEVLRQFQQVPYISPYAEFSHLQPGTIAAEKHACGVVHELLSLMIERRTLVDHLTHFRREYRFSQQVHGMIIRHPEIFYVSLKGARDSVFLREAYAGSELIDKDPLVLVKERLGELVEINAERFYRGKKEIKDDELEYIGSDDEDEDDDDDGIDYRNEGEIDGWLDEDEEASDDDLDDIRGQSRDIRQKWQRRVDALDHHVKPFERSQSKRVTLNEEKTPSTKAPRRPLGYVLKEKSLAMQRDTPKEKW